MPWSNYADALRQFSGYLSGALERGLTQQDVFQEISANARAAGIPLGFSDYSSLASLYSDYNRMNRAGTTLSESIAAFSSTGIDRSITGEMIGFAPWSPSLPDYLATGRLSARVQYEIATPEGPVQSWFTLDYRLSDLTTVGALLQDAQDFVDTSTTQSPPIEATLTGHVVLSPR